MKHYALLLAVALAVGVALAQSNESPDGTKAPATQPSPPCIDIAGKIAKDTDKAVQTFGGQGCMVIRSASRWETVREQLVAAGWKPKNKDDLAKVDFDKREVVFLFNLGDEGSEFSLRRFTGGQKAKLDIVMSYIIYKSRGAVVNNLNFILVAVPKSKELTVTVSTYHPLNGGPYATADKANMEWEAAFSPDSGDVVDGLRGVIHANDQTVKPGDDIFVNFTLNYANQVVVKSGTLARPIPQPKVWDGKYSNGFRNHAFEVTTPDGKTHFLQPKDKNWRKNIPHPEEVVPEKPYVLPEWRDGDTLKSLKALGLDTSKPGTYTITGIYAETGEKTDWQGKPAPIWGGNIATNTITVTVKAP